MTIESKEDRAAKLLVESDVNTAVQALYTAFQADLLANPAAKRALEAQLRIDVAAALAV